MIWDLIFPKYCLECKKRGIYICSDCLKKVRPGSLKVNHLSVFKYEGVIRKAVIALKYKFATDLADELTYCMVKWLNRSINHIAIKPSGNVVLVPIPLHKKRENWRGFNQALLIGEKVAYKMGWEFIPDLLIRARPSRPQVGLKGKERKNNLSGVFCVNNHIAGGLNHEAIVIFDDVYTTGSTINEARKTLIEAGFTDVKSLTIAS